jgi:hypothetical protein
MLSLWRRASLTPLENHLLNSSCELFEALIMHGPAAARELETCETLGVPERRTHQLKDVAYYCTHKSTHLSDDRSAWQHVPNHRTNQLQRTVKNRTTGGRRTAEGNGRTETCAPVISLSLSLVASISSQRIMANLHSLPGLLSAETLTSR